MLVPGLRGVLVEPPRLAQKKRRLEPWAHDRDLGDPELQPKVLAAELHRRLFAAAGRAAAESHEARAPAPLVRLRALVPLDVRRFEPEFAPASGRRPNWRAPAPCSRSRILRR